MNEYPKIIRPVLSALATASCAQLALLLILVAWAHADPLPPRFVDVAAELGLSKVHTGGGPGVGVEYLPLTWTPSIKNFVCFFF